MTHQCWHFKSLYINTKCEAVQKSVSKIVIPVRKMLPNTYTEKQTKMSRC